MTCPMKDSDMINILVYAAKLALMDSCDVRSETILSSEVHDSLVAAIELVGGFTEAEQAKMAALADGDEGDDPC